MKTLILNGSPRINGVLEREALVLELLIQKRDFEYGGKLHENTQNDIV